MCKHSQFSILNSQFITPSAAEKLSELDRLCVGAEGWSAESFMSEAAKDNGIVLFIMEGDRIAALLSGYTAVGEADITSVAVHPDFRRRGYALALMKRFEELLPAGTEDIFLEVRESNAGAIALYEKCGFERLSVRKNFYTLPRENAVVMRKTIIVSKEEKNADIRN
ncbi:MAG: ribosomal protein S18-alanine N-acetyltransferase [Ruminococcus sp.]|jgi:ribosomal-protein-alanine N-acetyltransferase|nr:ribosomal protein S18-alanine N-acetyltransferase [Ruminococcus sp.]